MASTVEESCPILIDPAEAAMHAFYQQVFGEEGAAASEEARFGDQVVDELLQKIEELNLCLARLRTTYNGGPTFVPYVAALEEDPATLRIEVMRLPPSHSHPADPA